MNQAVGRVIRHRHDYGAVLFCDGRFGDQQVKQQLSAWLRPYVQTPTQFGAVTRGLCQFFKHSRENVTINILQHIFLSLAQFFSFYF